MNTTQLQCFVETATELSFSRAAERLHVSQPTVSHQVRALEDELGVELLTRSTRTVRLTESGLVFLGYAQQMLELDVRSRRQLAHGARPGGRALRIGVHDGLEAQLVAPALGRLRREDASLDPAVRMGPDSELREMLEGGAVDVVLGSRDPSGEPNGATTFRRLRACPVVCACAEDHPLAARAGDVVTPSDLARAGRMAVCDPHHSAAAVIDAQRRAGAEVAPAQVMMAFNIEVSLALARAGVAFSVQPDIPAMRLPDLLYVPVEGLSPISFGVHVRRGRRAAVLDRFIELFREELGRDPRDREKPGPC